MSLPAETHLTGSHGLPLMRDFHTRRVKISRIPPACARNVTPIGPKAGWLGGGGISQGVRWLGTGHAIRKGKPFDDQRRVNWHGPKMKGNPFDFAVWVMARGPPVV